jgi:tripartite-type tricarboxylate transporter receptor subunit TctC
MANLSNRRSDTGRPSASAGLPFAVRFGRRFAKNLALLACVLLLPFSAARADDYPAKPIRLVVGLSAGGASDTLSRLLGKELTARLKQPVIVDNRPGAGGNLASEYVARAPADGYTLLFTADNHNLNPLIYQSAGYDAQKDFTGVILVSEYGLILCANSATPYKTMADVIAGAKKEPGKIFYGSSGIGLPNHIAMEKFLQSAKLKITHVPYKGSALSITDAVSGQIPLVMSTIAAALPFIKVDKLTPLMVTGPSRWPSLPQVPTVAQVGYPDATSPSWMGIVAPLATPKPVIDKLNRELAIILAEAPIRDAFFKLGMGVGGGSPKDFNDFLAQDLKTSRRVVSEVSIKVE